MSTAAERRVLQSYPELRPSRALTRYNIAWGQYQAALDARDWRRADYWRSLLANLREEVC